MTIENRQQTNFKGDAGHLKILLDALEQKNIRIWNEWRMDNANVLPNLQGVNLVGAKLTGVDFIGVDLTDADLSNAEISSSDLSGIVLVRANLNGTRFVHSTIYGGGLAKADLQNSNMVTKNPQIIYDVGNLNVRDTYNIQGSAGAVGPQASAHHINFNQLWNEVSSEIDLPNLADDLSKLKEVLKEKAVDNEHYQAITEIAEAEMAAKEGKGPKALEHLKNAGKWTFSVAEKIGTSLATAALKTALGL